jgi:hypothetical protein
MPEPTPADTIETYGQSLSVPPLDPRAVVQDAHLWYIADSPGMLYRCLRQVSDRCGVFQSVAESRPKAELAQLLKVSGANEIDAVLRRIDILERCCELWCTGRGRPVTPDVIRESDAISETYWLETIELNQKVNGNAAALLDGLPHIPAKRALRDKLQKKLRDYLETEGYLSAEDSLTLDEALRRLRREFGDDPEIETIVQRAGLRWESYALNQGADI